MESLQFKEKSNVEKMNARLHVVEELATHSQAREKQVSRVEAQVLVMEHILNHDYVKSKDHETALKATQKAVQKEMNKMFEDQTKEATAQLQSIQDQLKAMQDQLKEHDDAISNHTTASTASTMTAPTTPPAPSADFTGRDLSEMLAYQPKEFIQAICVELSKLRAVTKSKIHQMDEQGLPDDEKKLAVSDLSWQIGKCIKIAEKGVNELV